MEWRTDPQRPWLNGSSTGVSSLGWPAFPTHRTVGRRNRPRRDGNFAGPSVRKYIPTGAEGCSTEWAGCGGNTKLQSRYCSRRVGRRLETRPGPARSTNRYLDFAVAVRTGDPEM